MSNKMICKNCGMDYYQWNAPRPPKSDKCHRCGSDLSELKWSNEAVKNMIRTVDADILRDRVINIIDYISAANDDKSEYGKCIDEDNNGDVCSSWGHASNCPTITLGEIDMIIYGWSRFDQEEHDSYEIIYELKNPLLHPMLPKKVIYTLDTYDGINGSKYKIYDVNDSNRNFTYGRWEDIKKYKSTGERWNLEYWTENRRWNNKFKVSIELNSNNYIVEKLEKIQGECISSPDDLDWTFSDTKIIYNKVYAFTEDHARKLTFKVLSQEYPEIIEKYKIKPPVLSV